MVFIVGGVRGCRGERKREREKKKKKNKVFEVEFFFSRRDCFFSSSLSDTGSAFEETQPSALVLSLVFFFLPREGPRGLA